MSINKNQIATSSYTQLRVVKSINERIRTEDFVLHVNTSPDKVSQIENNLSSQIDLLRKQIERLEELNTKKTAKISVTSQHGIEFLSPAQIMHLEAQGNYTRIFLSDGSSRMVSQVLKMVFNKLPKNLFIRIHQSHAVCIEAITRYHSEDGYFVELTDGKNIPVSRANKKALLATFDC